MLRLLAASAVVFGLAAPAAAQDQEFWGAIVTAFTPSTEPRKEFGPHVYGLAWNFPSAGAAERAAASACTEQGGLDCHTDERGIHWFSTSASEHHRDYLDIWGVSRARCIAVGRDRYPPHLFDAYTGNSEAEARRRLITRGGNPHLETVRCNHR